MGLEQLPYDASIVLLWKMLTGDEFLSVKDAMTFIRHQATETEMDALRYLAGPGVFVCPKQTEEKKKKRAAKEKEKEKREREKRKEKKQKISRQP